jgi:1-acyl-sn-glycerol-3-phosphate acyltransferase
VLKTSSGKIRRAAVREAYLAGTLGAPSRATWLQVLRLQLASLAGRARRAAEAVPRQLHAAWAWSAFMLLVPLAALCILTLPRLEQRWTVCHHLARLHARLCGCTLRIEGADRMPTTGCVLVANHASYIDGLVLTAALPHPVRFVAKAELRDSRVLRPLFERMGAHFVRRFDPGHGVEDADALATGAHSGAPLLFFAEGTFSARPGLQAFRLGAFQAAARQGLPVVPVALAGTRAVLPDGSWQPRPGPLGVTLCAPHAPYGEDWHDLLTLRDAVRADILAHCGEDDATQR